MEKVGQILQRSGMVPDVLPIGRPVAAPAPRTPPAIPERFDNVRFATSEDRGPLYRKALKAVRGWVADVASGGSPMLALIGSQGTSKSHLLYCAAWDLFETHGIYPPCRRWYLLVDELRYGAAVTTPSGGRSLEPQDVRARLFSLPRLLLDEVRPTSGTDFDAMELAKLTMNAYDERRPILLSCNWARLDEMMGAPAADRYAQVVLTGPSARGKA